MIDMTTTKQIRPIDEFTPAQHAILAYAIHYAGGRIDWFPDIDEVARKKAIDGLFNLGLITPSGTRWLVSAGGYDALVAR